MCTGSRSLDFSQCVRHWIWQWRGILWWQIDYVEGRDLLENRTRSSNCERKRWRTGESIFILFYFLDLCNRKTLEIGFLISLVTQQKNVTRANEADPPQRDPKTDKLFNRIVPWLVRSWWKHDVSSVVVRVLWNNFALPKHCDSWWNELLGEFDIPPQCSGPFNT